MKIAIVHDHLGFRGGGERTVLLLALHLKADFITAYAHPDTFSEYQKELDKRLIKLSSKVLKMRVARFFWIRALFWRRRKLLSRYDLLIASGQTATEAVSNYARPGATKIVYTHSTPRRVFDQYEMSKRMYPFFLRPAYALFAGFWKRLYLRAIKKFDINIANSENVRKRIIEHTGSDANYVIWPPILTGEFKWLEPDPKKPEEKDYFLSWGRVDESKRIELIVSAFKKLPDQKLIVASGGPRLEKVKKLAQGAKNITILGWVDDKRLKELVGRCRAAVYIPIDEDAGITHLEANSAGKPVLGVKEGGLIESTIEGETGILIKANPKKEDIISAVKEMTMDWCFERKTACENHAKKFDAKIFLKKMEEAVNANDPLFPILGIDASRYEDPRHPGEGKRTGVEVYVKNLVGHLASAALEAGVRPRLFAQRAISELPLAIQKIVPGRKKWTKKFLSEELKNCPPQYFFTPGYYIPKNAPEKSFAVIHDVIFKSSPESYSFKERLNQEYAVRQNIKRAKKIITVSEHSKNELSRLYHVAPEKIAAIPMAYNREDNLERDKPRKNQIIYIGRIEKKKSVDVLAKAFFQFQKTNPDWKLILAGKPGHGYNEIVSLIKKCGIFNKVKLTGYIKEDAKWELLTESAIFIHPSVNEGSCIPLMEAWDAKTPAIVSDSAIMKEVGKTGALYFSAGKFSDLALRMSELADNHSLKLFLTEKGNEELNKLSWDKAAKDILNIITSA